MNASGARLMALHLHFGRNIDFSGPWPAAAPDEDVGGRATDSDISTWKNILVPSFAVGNAVLCIGVDPLETLDVILLTEVR